MKSEQSALGISPEVLEAYVRQNPHWLASVILTDIREHAVKAADDQLLLPDDQILVLYEDVCAIYQLDGDKVADVWFTPITEFIPDRALWPVVIPGTVDMSRWREWLVDALRYRKLRREETDRPGHWLFRWPHQNLRVFLGGDPGQPPKVEALELEPRIAPG